MGDKGAAAVSRVVSRHPKLTFLDLSSNMLTTDAAASLAKAISEVSCSTGNRNAPMSSCKEGI